MSMIIFKKEAIAKPPNVAATERVPPRNDEICVKVVNSGEPRFVAAVVLQLPQKREKEPAVTDRLTFRHYE